MLHSDKYILLTQLLWLPTHVENLLFGQLRKDGCYSYRIVVLLCVA